MHSKVSMVMPCYNKVEYIGEMLDSVIAQTWDNIELILVNDGSTDGTRAVIEEYAPKIRRRGYELVIIDQENAGVCAAARSGLENITGNYVCMVDADDELNPAYVSTMAGWMDQNADCDYCVCGCMYFTSNGKIKEYGREWKPVKSITTLTPENYILQDTWWAVWAYMLRKEYLDRCHIIDNYKIKTLGSHEPGFMIPMTAYGGKVKDFQEILYMQRLGVVGAHSQHTEFEAAYRHFSEYFDLIEMAIRALPDEVANFEKKKKLYCLTSFSRLNYMYNKARHYDLKDKEERLFNDMVNLVDEILSPDYSVIREGAAREKRVFIQAVKIRLYNLYSEHFSPKRIIGYGAMGQSAAKILPLLQGTSLEPTELWDAAGDGVRIKRPDVCGLTANDLVLVFPVRELEAEIREKLSGTGCRVLYRNDIKYSLAALLRRL